LQVFDIDTCKITILSIFPEGDYIYDIVSIDKTHYLLATYKGLLKVSKHQMINHYFKGKSVSSVCHKTDSFYLLGFYNNGLIVWDEEKN
jgi:hypothetical protein